MQEEEGEEATEVEEVVVIVEMVAALHEPVCMSREE